MTSWALSLSTQGPKVSIDILWGLQWKHNGLQIHKGSQTANLHLGTWIPLDRPISIYTALAAVNKSITDPTASWSKSYIRLRCLFWWALLVQMTKLVLPAMKKRKQSAIVNIGSAAATVLPSGPLYAVYAGTKASLWTASPCWNRHSIPLATIASLSETAWTDWGLLWLCNCRWCIQ